MNKNDRFVIEGLAGQKKLHGVVEIKGAKNAALKAMAGAILFDKPVVLENVPNTADIEVMAEILRKLGTRVEWRDKNKGFIEIDTRKINSTDIDFELARSMRASIVLTGPLLARFGEVSFSAPGGCVIGERPINLFIEGYRNMGAKISLEENVYKIKTPKGLSGEEIFFDFQSVGGTETMMMSAVLAKGITILKNCAMEPEIESVANWLNDCGADIKGIGTTTLSIKGTGGKLLSKNNSYETIPDRIETGSFIILGALCARELRIAKCRPDNNEALLNLLKKSGVKIKIKQDEIIVTNDKTTTTFKAVNIRTHEYPGFPTDLQAPMAVFLTQAEGESSILETIFEGRFKYAEDLINMGADIKILNPREIIIRGKRVLCQMPEEGSLYAHDIRAGFAIVLAALVSGGISIVNNAHLIDRGYEKLEERLRILGANIKRE